MNISLARRVRAEVDYPTSDGKPMAETDIHADVMVELKEELRDWYADAPNVYVSGNLLVYYEEGNPLKHLAPDVFMARVPKEPPRLYFLIWKEGRAPEMVMEITSKKTARNDLNDKLRIYRDIWKVKEYFLFDPYAEYLKPPLQGYRLRGGKYVPIKPVDGRLPSQVLGLHLERDGKRLRLYDPVRKQYLKTAREKFEEAEASRREAESAARREAKARQKAEAEAEKLRRELEALRRQLPKQP